MFSEEIPFDDPRVDEEIKHYCLLSKIQTKEINYKYFFKQLPPAKCKRVGMKHTVITFAPWLLFTIKLEDGTLEYFIFDDKGKILPDSQATIDWCRNNAPDAIKGEDIESLLSYMYHSYITFH